MKYSLTLLLVAVICVAACKKEEEPSMAPNLEFANAYPQDVVQYDDSVTISFYYKDPDGDLGENDTENTNLFITDTRNDVTFEFRVSQLSPDNSTITIEGNLNAHLKNLALIDENNATEELFFTVFVKDRAGNYSDTIPTNIITVHKDSTTIE